MGRNLFLFSIIVRVDGQLLGAAARVKRGFSGKEDGEDFCAFFGGLSGEAQCECVFMWENINELLPTGRGAVPIISSWENTRRNRGREMKEDHVLPFCSH